MNHLRKLYDWTLKWAEHRHSAWALGILSSIEGIFFPVPVDPFLLALCAAKPKRSLVYAAIATLTSIFGGFMGYLLGYFLWGITSEFFLTHVFSPDKFQIVIEKFQENAFLSIFLAAFTPIPYKVFALASGVAKISLSSFVLGSLLGRSIRFFSFGILFYFWGPAIKTYIDKHFEKVTISVGLVLIVFFTLYKM